MANTRMFAVALQSKDIKEVHVFKHTVPLDYNSPSVWHRDYKQQFIKTLESRSSVSLKDIEDFQLDTFKNSDKLFYTNYLKEYLGSIGNINYVT